MYDAVLVATDGEAGSGAAAARALSLAETFGATVHVLHVVDTRPEPRDLGTDQREQLRSVSEKRGRSATERIHEQAEDLGLTAVREVAEGVPHRVILEYGRANGVDLVAVGTRATAGTERRVGGTAGRVLALSPVPVLAVPPEAGGRATRGIGAFDRILLATDGSDPAEVAARQGIGIAERYGASVSAVYVVDERTYGFGDTPRSILGLLREGGSRAVESVAEVARERSVPVDTELLEGVPEVELLAFADGVEADLLVVGTRGAGGAPDPLLGSVTDRVAAASGIPVLVAG